MSLVRGLPRVSTFGSHGVEIGGVRWFLPRGKHHGPSNTFHLVCCSSCRESLSAGTPLDLFRQSCAGASALRRTLKHFEIVFSHVSYLCVWFLGQDLSYRSGVLRATIFSSFLPLVLCLGTAQLKREELRLGSHLSHGSKE